MRYLIAYLRFELLRAVRNRRYMILTIVIPAVLYYALGRQPATKLQTGGIPFATYFAVSMIAFSAMNSALTVGGARLSLERSSGWTRQVRITSLGTGGFVTAKVLTAVCVAIPGSVLVGVIAVTSGMVHLGSTTWLQLYLTVWVAVLPFAALGMVIGYAFDVDTAQVVTGMVLAGLAILGGFFAPASTFPTWLQDVSKVLPTYEMANGARAALNGAAPHLADITGLLAWTACLGLLFAWLYRRDESARSG